MRTSNTALILAATDLSNFLACRHRSGLDLAVASGALARPSWNDPFGALLQRRGDEHERRYVEALRGEGLKVVCLERHDSPDRTLQALRDGVDIVAQANLGTAEWAAYADVLCRVERPGAVWSWSYEAYDTKLARETRGGTVLQLSVYSELLGRVQGLTPERFHVVTPDPAHSANPFHIHSYRFEEYAAYYRLIRKQLLDTLRLGYDRVQADYYPEPVEACDVCRWWQGCNRRRRNDDHLSFIADIRRLQRTELEARGVRTLEAAASMPLPISFKPSRGSSAGYERLREQARVQHEQRTTGHPVHELLPVESGQGLCRLPPPSPGDLFLDLEGARFAREGGRDYLFGLGVLTPGDLFGPGFSYRSWWAYDDSEERRAFEEVVDLVMQAWQEHPGMHVYHYAHYEPTAFKRLMGRHASRAEEIDQLLRSERFVDLYAIARQTVRAGIESYSIKQLEQFYGFARTIDLREASANLRLLELALETNAPDSIEAPVRTAVEGYNRDDCRSTLDLRDWLERLRDALESQGTPVPRPGAPKDSEASDNIKKLDADVQTIRAGLLARLPPEANDPTHPDHHRWLLAFLIDWHRREDKAQWWEYYRLKDLPEEELLDEAKAIADLEFIERVGFKLSVKGKPTGTVTDRYAYPGQAMEIGKKATLKLKDGRDFGKVVDRNLSARTIDIEKGPSREAIHPSAVFDADVRPADVIQRAVMRLAESLDTRACGLDLLFRQTPRLASGAFEMQAGESAVDFAVRIVTDLDHTTLAIQGPPGAGKTFAGARMIRALVRSGRRVGVTAVSHKVIQNLLDEVRAQSVTAGERLRMGRKVNENDESAQHVHQFEDNETALAAVQSGNVDVMGATSWFWARPECARLVDVLFVDEAGQMSLANALGVSQAAKNLVLLGDPQQLEQPQKASHPDGVDVSALEHVIGGAKTMPAEHGIFMPETWRLAPAVCAFTSEVFYEGQLHSRSGLENQRIAGSGGFDGAGLWWVPVEHDGNQNWAAEEVDTVAAIVGRLLDSGARWTGADGADRPLGAEDIRVVAPYNAQVNRLAERLQARGVPVGTVDKFQGQTAVAVIYSMATSRPEDAPRGMEFLYSLNRLNVATSRARCAAILVASPRLFEPACRTPRQMQLANALCRYREMATVLTLT